MAGEKWAAVADAEAYMFTRPLPYVPDGELGVGCHTREQAEWIAAQMARRRA